MLDAALSPNRSWLFTRDPVPTALQRRQPPVPIWLSSGSRTQDQCAPAQLYRAHG
jgi:hypothetical protein